MSLNQNISKIYHGGGIGGGGWSSPGAPGADGAPGAPGAPGETFSTIRLVASEKEWHQGNSEPAIANLHTTPSDSSYGWKTYDYNKRNRAFATIGLMHYDWEWILSGVTKVNMHHHFYHETTIASPNNIAKFVTSLYIIRAGESIDFASMAGSYTFDLDCATSAPFQLLTVSLPDVTINNPAGSATEIEPIFHWRLRRLDTADGDSYSNVIHHLGSVLEFPITP